MKNKILIFIIGVLTGAIIMSVFFLVFNKLEKDTNIKNFPFMENEQIQMPNEQTKTFPTEMPK